MSPHSPTGTGRPAQAENRARGGDPSIARDEAWFTGQPTTDTAAWFLVVSVASRLLAPGAATAVLLVVFAAGSVLMRSGLRYPKNGLPQRLLLVLVPLSIVALWLV